MYAVGILLFCSHAHEYDRWQQHLKLSMYLIVIVEAKRSQQIEIKYVLLDQMTKNWRIYFDGKAISAAYESNKLISYVYKLAYDFR